MFRTFAFDDAFPTNPGLPPHGPGRWIGGSEFLSFSLGGRTYGLEVSQVEDIRDHLSVEQAARTLPVDGARVPLVDLRTRIDHGAVGAARAAVALVVAAAGRRAALLVDGVSDVVSVPEADACRTAAAPGDRVPPLLAPHVLGVGHARQGAVSVLDLGGLLTDPALGLIGH